MLLGMALGASSAHAASAFWTNRDALHDYADSNYDNALTKFLTAKSSAPEQPALGHNVAGAYYKLHKFDEAQKEIGEALKDTRDPALQAKLHYNSGNIHVKQEKYTEAIQEYVAALKLDPNDQDAKYNLELARALLKQNSEKKEQQQQQQKQQNKQDQKQDQKDEDKKDQDKKDQQQQQDQQDQQQAQKDSSGQGSGDQKKMSKEEAERLLDALKNSEKDQKGKRVPMKGEAQPDVTW